MAIPLPVPTTHPQTIRSTTMEARSPLSSAHLGLYSPFSSSIAMSPQYGNSCALTILKADAEHPINAHAPIHQKEDPDKVSTPATQPSRFAPSFSNLRSASQAASSGFDSSVNVHAVSDHGILLPFLDRPSEVKELLFDTKPNESLMYRLCRVFGGDPEHPTRRGKDERWDEMLELLIELDRPLLDDEDWLARLESLVMERSPALWAQLARCLGADGLTMRPAAQPSSSRFDSWALPSRYVNAAHDNDSPLSAPSAASSDDGHDARDEPSLSVSVEPLDELPQSFSEQPAGKMQHSSLRQASSPAPSPTFLAPEPAAATSGQASPGEVFAMSAGNDDSAMSGSLEDIMEEPGASAQSSRPTPRRARSHSGKFAGLRIQALSSSSPPASRRASNASELGTSAKRDPSSSPLPTGAMSPAGLAPDSPGASPSRAASTSFSKHRRLSTMMVQNNPTQQQHQHRQHERSSPDAHDAVSPKATTPRRQRGVSEAAHSLQGHTFQSQPRRRAQSFARSFAELKSPSEHLEQLRAEHAKAEADRLAEDTRRISLQDTHTASAPAAPTGALGLHRDSTSCSLLDPTSALTAGAKSRRASVGRKRVGSVGSKAGASRTGSTSPSLPGLLPDGRTRHPSGSCGSRDLSESIAAFRATMGMSTSPSPSEHNFSETGDGMSDAGKSSDSANRKRKGSGGAELPKPTSRTANTAEAKASRKGSPTNAEQYQSQFEQPKHMQELESRNKASGASGSGLALGGGFSLAKSGANFRRQSHDSAPTAQGGWRSGFNRRDGAARTRGAEPYSFRSPPAVHRRPGGFVSLAQEYERARHHRRSSETAFSIHSNAVASSPSSSLASLDLGGSEGMGGSHRQGSEDPIPRLELEAATPGDPTPKAGTGGGITPRASFVSSSTRFAGGGGGGGRPQQEGYPFPNLLTRVAASSSDDAKSSDHLAPATPLSPLQACRTRLSPSLSALSTAAATTTTTTSPRSPSIVFPISPNPSISRAHAFQKTLSTPRCQSTFSRIESICGTSVSDSIRNLITTTERSSMPDEVLLEEVARRLGLVDHERARLTGGTEAEEADIILAEEGYQDRWDVFADLCRALGVGEYELALARKRCGPAIDLCSGGGGC
ncbi:uncharacterized protein UTRI_04593_B [Ustilago trichophora]|uniref:Uncharacterized protein n=1 Tax=Ustilago trichophora TaxID=86804 RepID=A0A5C3EEY2_9BASI|nr:uncharacterized protein UTRI_04593_B [Ustilago trichophora]